MTHLLFCHLAPCSDSFISASMHTEVYATGVIAVEVTDVSPSGWLYITVQASVDERRWGDYLEPVRWQQPGSYEILVPQVPPYLRLSYEVQGRVTFGAVFRGYLYGESR